MSRSNKHQINKATESGKNHRPKGGNGRDRREPDYSCWDGTILETPKSTPIENTQKTLLNRHGEPLEPIKASDINKPTAQENHQSAIQNNYELTDTWTKPKSPGFFQQIFKFTSLYIIYCLTILLLASSVGIPFIGLATNPFFHIAIFASNTFIHTRTCNF